ncbi:hypothetical protein [Rothia mucilaginosa]|uniref:hypothetical protein n=1 Tax=Rothia mucilaginosa TaxID=43675 RepID=UPI0026EF2AE0|nr:hypothetical protein [Rothia mucilaginosa]
MMTANPDPPAPIAILLIALLFLPIILPIIAPLLFILGDIISDMYKYLREVEKPDGLNTIDKFIVYGLLILVFTLIGVSIFL